MIDLDMDTLTDAVGRTLCLGCERPMVGAYAWDKLTPVERKGLLKLGGLGRCIACYHRRRRGRGRLDSGTVANLRRALGIPVDGPTPKLVAAWRADEGEDEEGEAVALPDPDPDPDPSPTPVEGCDTPEVDRAATMPARPAADVEVPAVSSHGRVSDLDADTLAAAVAGDPRALAVLLARLRPLVVAYCARRLPRRGDVSAEDVAQEALISLLAALPRIEESSVRQIRLLAMAIAYRRVADACRRRPPEWPAGELLPAIATYVSPERLCVDREGLDELAEALRELGPCHRVVIRLRAGGMQLKDIASVLGRTESSVRVTHHRAMLRLRAWRDAR